MPEERAYLRELARRVAEIAASPENEAICRRWRDVNAMRRPDRAPVWCRPVGAWAELLPSEALVCQDPWMRMVECELRMTLIKHDIGDDTPVEGTFAVPAILERDPLNTWGVEMNRIPPSRPGGAWVYDPPLKRLEDIERLRLPSVRLSKEQTEAALARAHDLLGDLLPVRLTCEPPLNATICTVAAALRGLTQLMIDMIESPDWVHRLMAHLRDGVLQTMDQVEAMGLLSPNNVGGMFCSDPIGPDPDGGPLTYANLWGCANSQEFDPVSPAMWEEFLLQYQKPILERFGLTAYGCCENLTEKIDGVLSIPNLRLFVCSAWTDLGRVIERVAGRYVIMWRQKASAVVFTDDPEELRRDLEEGMRQLQGCHYQVVLRELQTLAGHPDRLHVWSRLAIETAEKYA